MSSRLPPSESSSARPPLHPIFQNSSSKLAISKKHARSPSPVAVRRPGPPLLGLDESGSSLTGLDESKSANAGPTASDPPPAPIPAATPPPHWVQSVPRSAWRLAIRRLQVGYIQKSGQGYPAAQVNATGCVLAQKKPNRILNGYVQATPVVEVGKRGLRGDVSASERPHGAHRIVVLLHHRYVVTSC